MIIEERIYTLHPGKQAEYLARFEKEGAEIYLATLKNVVGIFTTEVGPLNQLVTIASYNTFEERLTRRGALRANPAWENYAVGVRPLIARQENRILTPAPFSPLR